MTGKKTKMGATLEAWCSKCKTDATHAVETVKKDGTAGQVRCQTCSSVHAYKAPQGAAGDPKKKTSAPATKRRKKGDTAVGESEAGRARPYSMDGEFSVSDIVDHPKFALGRVTATRPGGKMEVAFESGTKLLVCKDMGSLALRRGRGARVVVPVPVEVEVEEAETTDEDAETPDVVEVREEE